MAQVGVIVTKEDTFGGRIADVGSIRVFRGQYKYKDLKDEVQYITVSIKGSEKTDYWRAGEVSLPKPIAKMVAQALLDVCDNAAAVELQTE